MYVEARMRFGWDLLIPNIYYIFVRSINASEYFFKELLQQKQNFLILKLFSKPTVLFI